MKREDKVISLGLAKEIDLWSAEKDVAPTVSQYYWVRNKADSFFFLQEGVKPLDKKYYPAYDTAELGEMLPRAVPTLKTINDLWIWREDEYNDWMLQYGTLNKFRDSVEAEARGRLYLWLLKEGYIK